MILRSQERHRGNAHTLDGQPGILTAGELARALHTVDDEAFLTLCDNILGTTDRTLTGYAKEVQVLCRKPPGHSIILEE